MIAILSLAVALPGALLAFIELGRLRKRRAAPRRSLDFEVTLSVRFSLSRDYSTASTERGPSPTYFAVGRISRPSRFCSRM
jgi:hypothetical protein